MYAFYLLGRFMHRLGFLRQVNALRLLIPGATAALLVVLFTYRLNSGNFSFPPLDAVVILFSSHGHALWFPLTALAGCLMILLIAKAVPPTWTPMVWMGQNTLILMCLNGIFYHFVNPPVSRWVVERLPGTPLILSLAALAITAASLAKCIPLIVLLKQWLPQLVGRPTAKGPLLSNLV